MLQMLSTQMELYLGDKMIYPTLGNHESVPVNRSVLVGIMLRGEVDMNYRFDTADTRELLTSKEYIFQLLFYAL